MNRNVSKGKPDNKKKGSKVLIRLIIAIVAFLGIFLILISTSIPKQYKLEEGQIAQFL